MRPVAVAHCINPTEHHPLADGVTTHEGAPLMIPFITCHGGHDPAAVPVIFVIIGMPKSSSCNVPF